MPRQGGVALILAVWTLLLLSTLVGSALLIARGDALRARQVEKQTAARVAADGAIRAAGLVLATESGEGLVALERNGLQLTIGRFDIDVEIAREAGKVDINHALPELIVQLLSVAGKGDDLPALAGKISEWRKASAAMGNGHSVVSPVALLDVPGLAPDSLGCVLPYLTTYSATAEPDLEYASEAVRAAVRAVRGQGQQQAGGTVAQVHAAAGQLFAMTVVVRKAGEIVHRRYSVIRVTGSAQVPILFQEWATPQRNAPSCRST